MKTKRINKILLCLALLLMIGGELLLSPFALVVSAESTAYSDVLDDLKRDSSFNIEDYPAKPDDTSLQVIHIGEGENGELFIYVYQPCDDTKDYRAKFINMSVQNPTNKDLSYELYSLTWVNSNGVFDKYIVNDFTVSNDAERFYNIATVYRPYDETVDTSSEAIDSIQCKGFEVGQYWRTYYYNNVLFYESRHIDTVEIEIQATGTIRYTEGFKLYTDKCDSHYVAFSINNYNVDEIFDADITYTLKEYHYTDNHINGVSNLELISETFIERDYLSSKETGSNDGDGWFGKKYSWNRIQDVDTFIAEAEDDANDGFSETELVALENAQFVFRFKETDYTVTNTSSVSSSHYTLAENIGILRLHFLSEGKTYNLGCVSDLVGTDSNPELNIDILDNIENLDIFQKLYSFLLLIIFLLILILLATPLRMFFKTIFQGVKFLFNILWLVITLPFQFLEQLVSKKRTK